MSPSGMLFQSWERRPGRDPKEEEMDHRKAVIALGPIKATVPKLGTPIAAFPLGLHSFAALNGA